MTRTRQPHPALRPFVAQLWASDAAAPAAFAAPRLEHALPTGCAHLVFRLGEAPLRIAGAGDAHWQTLEGAMLGGPRSRYYRRELWAPSASVGALLRPGATLALFGVPASEFAECHVPLEALWGADAARLCTRIAEAGLGEWGGTDARLALLESALLARLPRVRCVHPGIAALLDSTRSDDPVAEAVQASGLSHRHFILKFREAAGLAPKTWLRLRRFRRALDALHACDMPLAALAQRCGYSDQAHFCREFAEFAGLAPAAYRACAPRDAGHVPLDAACATGSNSCKTARRLSGTLRASPSDGVPP